MNDPIRNRYTKEEIAEFIRESQNVLHVDVENYTDWIPWQEAPDGACFGYINDSIGIRVLSDEKGNSTTELLLSAGEKEQGGYAFGIATGETRREAFANAAGRLFGFIDYVRAGEVVVGCSNPDGPPTFVHLRPKLKFGAAFAEGVH